MAASTLVNGNDVGLYVGGELIGCLTSNSFSSTNDEIDVTSKDNGGVRQVLTGGTQAEFPFAGYFNPAAGFGLADLLAIHQNGDSVLVKQMLDDELAITAYAKLNELTWDGELNAGSKFSGKFTVDGEWEFDLTPAAPGDEILMGDTDTLWGSTIITFND